MCVCLSKYVNCGRCLVLTEFQIDVFRVILRMLCMMIRRRGLCSSDVYFRQYIINGNVRYFIDVV